MVPYGLILEGLSPEHESEHIALQALGNRWLWKEDLLVLTEYLPSCTRHFQHSNSEMNGSCSFLMGAYIHGCSAGILNNSKSFPLVTSLVTSVIRGSTLVVFFGWNFLEPSVQRPQGLKQLRSHSEHTDAGFGFPARGVVA